MWAAGAICCSRAAPKRSGSLALVPACSLAQRRRPGNLGSKCRCDLQLDSEMAAARAHLLARRPRWRFFSCSAAAALLFVPISASRLPTSARASGRPVASSRDRENQQCSASKSLLVFLLPEKKLFPLPALPGAAGPTDMGPPARAEVLRVLYCSACRRRLPAGSRRPAGAVPQAPSACRRREIFGGGAGGGGFRGQRGGQGRNITFLVSPGITRSRQGASIECHVGGSKRPSRGG